jgi:lipooligosaccharide transport system permease protein
VAAATAGTAVQQTMRVVEHHAYGFKPFWRSGITSSLLTPALFLAAIGMGLGSLIEDDRAASLGGVSYLAFVGTGLLAASAMQVAANESMFPVMAGIKWIRFFHATVATPVTVHALVAGQFVWTTIRLLAGSALYLFVLALFGVVDSPTALLAIPAAALCGLAFATPIAAFSSTQENDQWFTVILRCGIMPLYLFSGTFFPITQLPPLLQSFAKWTPLWHGVQLCRGAVLGGLSGRAALAHVAYLSVFVVVGWLVANRLFTRRMVP